MYRGPAKVDANQAAIRDVLRRAGRSVASTASIGNGFPDLAIGYAGQCCPHDCTGPLHLRNKVGLLIEVKDGELAPSRQRLTPDEAAFHAQWRGPLVVVKTMADALRVTGFAV